MKHPLSTMVRQAARLALTLAALAWGVAATAQPTAPLLFAVSEGTSGGGSAVTDEQMATK